MNNVKDVTIEGRIKFDYVEGENGEIDKKDYSKITYDGWSIMTTANDLRSLINFLSDEKDDGYIDYCKVTIIDEDVFIQIDEYCFYYKIFKRHIDVNLYENNVIYNFDYFYNLFKNTNLKFELVHANENDECKTLSFENLKFNLSTKYTELKNIDSEMIIFSNHLVTIICNKTHTSVFRYDYIKNCIFKDNVLKIALDDNSVIEINF